MQPTLKVVEDEKAVEKIYEDRETANQLYVFSGEDDFKEKASKVADSIRQLAVTSVFVPKKGDPSLKIYKGQEEQINYEGETALKDMDVEKLTAWSKKNRVPLFGEITEDNYEIYIQSAKKGMFWVCLDPKNLVKDLDKYSTEIVKAAKANADYPFVWINTDEFEAHQKEELGCEAFPTTVLQRGDLLGDQEETKVDRFVKKWHGAEKKDEKKEADKKDDKKEEDKKEEFPALSGDNVLSWLGDIKEGKVEPEKVDDGLDELDDENDEEDIDGEGELDDDLDGEIDEKDGDEKEPQEDLDALDDAEL